ncbi:hypothetical protein BC833DRAFT_571994 [Globomyces pollinis-pini]|nr:hypothetical protein BC833DRAFT_571994 [Globomyces pollinis-pini]
MVDEAALKFEKSIKKQTSKRAFTAGSSFKNFLDALAHKLAILYSFPWNDPLFPTIADVLHAKEHSAWTYNNHYISIEKSMEDCRLDSESKGIPIADISLPEIMDEEQWVKLKELIIVSVQKTPNHIIPRTTNGKCTIVIPTSVFNDKTITFFKKVGVAVLLFAHEDDVVVIDEGELISSTNHESHSKRKRKKESSVISS